MQVSNNLKVVATNYCNDSMGMIKINSLLIKLKRTFPNVEIKLLDQAIIDEILFIDLTYKQNKNINGVVYGFVKNGNIYLNKNKLNSNTIIHEYGHIFQHTLPIRFNIGIDLLNKSMGGQKLIARTKTNSGYANYSQAEIQAEALVTAMGDKGESVFNNAPNALAKFKQWVNDFFKRLGDKLGIAKLSPDYNFDKFVRDAVGDILSGKEIVQEAIPSNNKVNLSSEQNNKQFVSSPKVNIDENGNIILERLRPEEERGRNKSGQTNALATIVLSRLHKSIKKLYGENSQQYQSIANEEETYLEDFAKEQGIWVEDADKKLGNFFDKGQEQRVYIDPTNTQVVNKINDGSLEPNWLSALDRIALQNANFGDATAYTLKGFGRDTDGKFVFILEQPYIIPNRTTELAIKEDMAKRGFEPLSNYDDSIQGTVEEKRSFINKATGVIVEDLHLKNVFDDGNGNLLYIDPVISLDTEDKGYEGDRIAELPDMNFEDNIQFQYEPSELTDLVKELRDLGFTDTQIKTDLLDLDNSEASIDTALGNNSQATEPTQTNTTTQEPIIEGKLTHSEIKSESKSSFKKAIKYSKYFLLALFIVLLLTNPTVKDFKEFLGGSNGQVRRKNNFILFSIYQVSGDKYVGILKNFIEISR